MIPSSLSIRFFLLSYILLSSVAQEPIGDFSNCQETHLVRDFNDPTFYVQICILCKQDYVLSFEFSTCTHYSSLSDTRFQYCKRQSRIGWCEEAVCSLQLQDDGSFASQIDGNSNKNCAIFKTETKDCIRPRFGFSLNKETKEISKDDKIYCAVKDNNNNCLDYFSTFVPQTSLPSTTTYSALLYQFVNFNQIDNINSSILGGVQCLEGYEILQYDNSQFFKYYGCSPKNYSIKGCSEYDKYTKKCLKCNAGYSINENETSCSNEISNCSIHSEANKVKTCKYCNSMYYQKNGECVQLTNCAVQDPEDQLCKYCSNQYYGKFCQQMKLTNDRNKYEFNRRGECVRCGSENLFFNILKNECQNRKLSTNCQIKNGISDSCSTYECSEGYIFNLDSLPMGQEYFSQNPNLVCSDLEKYISTLSLSLIDKQTESTFNFYLNEDTFGEKEEYGQESKIFYYLLSDQSSYKNAPQCLKVNLIGHCLSYHQCLQMCIKCEDGYQLVANDNNKTQRTCLPKSNSTINRCLIYTEDQQGCIQCEDYYFNNRISCDQKIKFCMNYNKEGICIKCKSNILIAHGKCKAFCSKSYGENSCLDCIQMPDQLTIHIIGGTTGAIRDQNCEISTNGCIELDVVSNICIQCSEGYSKYHGSCTLQIQDNSITNYKFDKQVCTIDYTINCQGVIINGKSTCGFACPSNFGLYKGNCNSCFKLYGEGCIACNNEKSCQQCDQGYLLSQEDGRCHYSCTQTNCISCYSDTECALCQNELFLFNNKCVPTCDHYYQVESNYFVSTISGFYSQNICIESCNLLSYSGDQEDQKICTSSCKQGYFQNNESKKCQKCTEVSNKSSQEFAKFCGIIEESNNNNNSSNNNNNNSNTNINSKCESVSESNISSFGGGGFIIVVIIGIIWKQAVLKKIRQIKYEETHTPSSRQSENPNQIEQFDEKILVQNMVKIE